MDDLFFEDRFLDRHAGSSLSDASVAIVELVANAWDARATKVEIDWPSAENGRKFRISDNGEGMTDLELERRWKTFDYDTIVPMTYETFIRRAEKRMLGLRDKLKDAPFLKAAGVDSVAFLEATPPRQAEIEFAK